MTAGSGPAAPSLRASLRLFRLAMSAQRQRAAAAANAPPPTPTPIARPVLLLGRHIVQAAAAATTSLPRPPAPFAAPLSSFSPRPAAMAWQRRAGAAATVALLPMMAAAFSSSASARAFASSAAAAAPMTSAASVRLNDLHPALGATKAVRRVGRGDGSGRGTTCGRGTKGQGARKGSGKPGLLFDGGTRQLRKWPKVHARPGSPVEYDYVNVADVAAAARAGLLGGIDFSGGSLLSPPPGAGAASAAAAASAAGDAPPLPLVTMKHLRDAGLVSKTVRWGVKLLARAEPGAPRLPPMRLQVSAASAAARRAVARSGGRLEAVYYNQLGLRAVLKPEAWEREGRPLPRGVRAWPPRDQGKGFDQVGCIPPRPATEAAAAGASDAAAAV